MSPEDRYDVKALHNDLLDLRVAAKTAGLMKAHAERLEELYDVLREEISLSWEHFGRLMEKSGK